MPSGSPGFSRWEACQGRGILPGTPDPAEAGTPDPCCPDEKWNGHQPVGCLPGPGHPAGNAWSGWSRDAWSVLSGRKMERSSARAPLQRYSD